MKVKKKKGPPKGSKKGQGTKGTHAKTAMPKKVPGSAPSGSSNASSNGGGSATKAGAKVQTAHPPKPYTAAPKKSTSTTGSTTSKFASPNSGAIIKPVELQPAQPAVFVPPGRLPGMPAWEAPPHIPKTYEAQSAEYWRQHNEATEAYKRTLEESRARSWAPPREPSDSSNAGASSTDLDASGRPRRAKGMHPALADFDTTYGAVRDPGSNAGTPLAEPSGAPEEAGASKRPRTKTADEEGWTLPKPSNKRRRSSIMPGQQSAAVGELPAPIQEVPMEFDESPAEVVASRLGQQGQPDEDEEMPRATTGGKTLASMASVARPSREDTPEKEEESVPAARSPTPPAPRSPSHDLAPHAGDGISLGSSRASSSGFVIKLVRSTPKAGKAASPVVAPSASPPPPSPSAVPLQQPAEPAPSAVAPSVAAQDPTPPAPQIAPSSPVAQQAEDPVAEVPPIPASAPTPLEAAVSPPPTSSSAGVATVAVEQGASGETPAVAEPASTPLSRIASEMAAPSSPASQQRGATPSALDQLDAFFGIEEEIAPAPSITPRVQQESVAPSPPVVAPSYPISASGDQRRLPPPPRPRRPSSLPRARKPSPLIPQPSPLRQVDTPPPQSTTSTAQAPSSATRSSTRAPPEATTSTDAQPARNGSMAAPPLPSGLVGGALSFASSQNGAVSPSDLARLASGLASDPFAQYIASQQAAHLEAQNPNLDFGYDTDIGSITRNPSPAISASASSKASTPLTGGAHLHHPPAPPPPPAPVPAPAPATGGKGKGKAKADGPAKGKGKKKRASKASAADDGDKEQPVCSHCGTTTSPLFRRDPGTGLYICNVSCRSLALSSSSAPMLISFLISLILEYTGLWSLFQSPWPPPSHQRRLSRHRPSTHHQAQSRRNDHQQERHHLHRRHAQGGQEAQDDCCC